MGTVLLHKAGRGTVGGGAAAPTWTATGNPGWLGSGNSGNTTLTWTGVNIGTATSDRIVVAVVRIISVGNFTDFTIDGVSATQAIQSTSSFSQLMAIYYRNVTAGTSVNFAVTTGAGALGSAIVQVGILTGVTATPTSTGKNDVAIVTGPATQDLTLTVPSTGFYIWGGIDLDNQAITTGNVTEDFNLADANGPTVLGHNSTAGSQTVTLQGSGGGYILGSIGATWGP